MPNIMHKCRGSVNDYVDKKRKLRFCRHKGPSIKYVVSVGGTGLAPDDLLHRPYLIKKR